MAREEAIRQIKEYIYDGDDNAISVEAGEMAIEALSENKGEWIPVSERLPEDGSWAIFTDGKAISVERFKLDAENHFFPSGRWFELDKAIAWQPLPKPYKAESEDK